MSLDQVMVLLELAALPGPTAILEEWAQKSNRLFLGSPSFHPESGLISKIHITRVGAPCLSPVKIVLAPWTLNSLNCWGNVMSVNGGWAEVRAYIFRDRHPDMFTSSKSYGINSPWSYTFSQDERIMVWVHQQWPRGPLGPGLCLLPVLSLITF